MQCKYANISDTFLFFLFFLFFLGGGFKGIREQRCQFAQVMGQSPSPEYTSTCTYRYTAI
jgi:hypothetical protein